MIIKNCFIYDEVDQKEKLVDFIIDGSIIDYDENLADKAINEEYIKTEIDSIDRETIEKINNGYNNIIIDAKKMITMPGGIDAHVHFDTPGFTQREDFYHGSMSAAAGGITTVIDMPCTSLPPVTNRNNFDVKYDAVKDTSVVDYAFYGGVNANSFDNLEKRMSELADNGVKGFKTYFISGMETFPRINKSQFVKILEISKQLNLPVLLHAEDYELITSLSQEYASLPDDYKKYYKTRPELCEILAVADAVNMAKYVDGNLHIVHIASYKAAQIINELNGRYNITYETCPHYLYFSKKDFAVKGSSLKTAPVLKSSKDKDKLWKYLSNGKCSFVASDHAPCSLAEKSTGAFSTDYGGIPGTQTLLPVVFSEGYIKRKLPLERLYDIVSVNPATRYNLYPQKGSLQKNSDADFVFINQNHDYVFKKENLLSKGENTPFDGETFAGKIMLTILRGKIIFSANCGITVNKGYGKYL